MLGLTETSFTEPMYPSTVDPNGRFELASLVLKLGRKRL